MGTFLQDIRYGLRMLFKHPGFTAVAVLALALGIGANSAIFSVVNGVLLRPLPYEDADRLVMIWEHNFPRNRPRNVVAPFNFIQWRQQVTSFEGLAAFGTGRMTLTGAGEPERIHGQNATANYFSLLSVAPLHGRVYTPEEDRPGAERVVVLGHRLWIRRFGGDLDIVGKTVTFDADAYTVIGIMPPDFSFFAPESEFWTPLRLNPGMDWSSSGRSLLAFGRLRPGVSLTQAQVEISTIAGQLTQAYPEFDTGWGVNLVPLHEQIVGDVRLALFVLLGAVGFVLLIACANVANLLLARAAARQREIAVRTSLGAGRMRIIRQLLTESLLLSGLGGVLGLLFTMWGIDLLVYLSPQNVPRLDNVRIDGMVLGFTLAVSLLTGVVFGIVPGIAAARTNPNNALKEGIRGAGAETGHKARGALVVIEMALSLVLLVCAGLMMKSFMRLQGVDPGFNPENVLTLKIPLPGSQYTEGRQRVAFFQQLIDRLETLPGVQSANAVSYAPFTGLAPATSFWRADREAPGPGDRPVTEVRWTHPGYFGTMGIPLRNGLDLTDKDMAGNPRIVVINETLARSLFPGEDPIGKTLSISWGDDRPYEIIGVVADHRYMGLDAEIRPMVYWPHNMEPSGFMYVMVRTTVDPMSLMNAIKQEVLAMDPLLPVYDFRTMDTLIATTIAQPKFNSLMLGLFSVVALILAAVGIYGVMSYAVTQRTQEMGIRMALGAQKGDVIRLVVRQGMTLAAIGVAIGLLASVFSTRVLTTLLYGVSATDPATFAGIALTLTVVAFLACWLPARRATRVDPMTALRYE